MLYLLLLLGMLSRFADFYALRCPSLLKGIPVALQTPDRCQVVGDLFLEAAGGPQPGTPGVHSHQPQPRGDELGARGESQAEGGETLTVGLLPGSKVSSPERQWPVQQTASIPAQHVRVTQGRTTSTPGSRTVSAERSSAHQGETRAHQGGANWGHIREGHTWPVRPRCAPPWHASEPVGIWFTALLLLFLRAPPLIVLMVVKCTCLVVCRRLPSWPWECPLS